MCETVKNKKFQEKFSFFRQSEQKFHTCGKKVLKF